MSDPKRATIITVGAPKSVKNNVNKTVRLAINLDESNESKYPELNYKELVIATAKKKRIENGKTAGLDPFSDNDDDVERVARKFEQKYGGKSTYGRKGRSKYEEFADIGAGYDENDSFIDNTHGYDEMIPPECDTLYGGFYINSGSLEFKTVPENQTPNSDGDVRRNKRRLSSSSSEEESSDSSTNSDSQDVKENKTVPNGNTDSHKTEHRKKKVKKNEKKKSSVSPSDTTAPTSGKQTSDEACPEGSSTSQSDSLTSKPAPSSENLITSDSSRETEAKFEVKLPQIVSDALEKVQLVSREKDNPGKDLKSKTDQCILKLEQSLNKSGASSRIRREAWSAAGGLLGCSRAALLQRTRKLSAHASNQSQSSPAQPITTPAPTPAPIPAPAPTQAPAPVTVSRVSVPVKRKAEDRTLTEDFSRLSPDEKEAEIVESLRRLKALIDERKPDMIATYNAECERVQEERKKLQIASVDGMPHVDKRLPKRRFPWCPLSRALLAKLGQLAGSPADAASLLAKRALPLFPAGFVRMPTLLRQADLNKDIKATDLKRQAFGSTSQPQPVQMLSEPIQFPSSLTVTTTTTTIKPIEKPEKDRKAVQANDKKEVSVKKKEGLIRVKSPAALNDMVKKDEVTQKQIESMKTLEKFIPHPILIPVNFAKPDKRPPEKKKKEVLIVSDVDPLAEARDDSSSDIEVIEDKVTEEKCSVSESDKVPSDKVKGVEFTKQEFELLMKDLQEMENSQEQKTVNFNSFGGVITNAKNESSKQFNGTVFDSENKNKFAERTSFKEIDGCNTVNG